LTLIMEPESDRELCVHLNQLTLLSVWVETILLHLVWPERG